MSRGSIGCVPVAAKYGEQPMRRRIVTLSAQNTEYAPLLHFDWSPSTALYKACRTSKCGRSTRPFARVVAGNANVVDVILLRQIFDRLHKCTAIIRHYLLQRTPSTYHVFEEPIAKRRRIFRSQHTKFDVVDH